MIQITESEAKEIREVRPGVHIAKTRHHYFMVENEQSVELLGFIRSEKKILPDFKPQSSEQKRRREQARRRAKQAGGYRAGVRYQDEGHG